MRVHAVFQDEDYPTVLVAIFVEYPTAFIREFFENIANLKYPKSKIDLFIHYAVSRISSVRSPHL